MQLPDSLNPVARQVAIRLLSAHPEFAAGLDLLGDGHFEASIPAPSGSRAGALLVSTANDGDIWVHFAPREMWHRVDDAEALLRVLHELVGDSLLFARVSDAAGAWVHTTLVRTVEELELAPGHTGRVISWSGRRDRRVTAMPGSVSDAQGV